MIHCCPLQELLDSLAEAHTSTGCGTTQKRSRALDPNGVNGSTLHVPSSGATTGSKRGRGVGKGVNQGGSSAPSAPSSRDIRSFYK